MLKAPNNLLKIYTTNITENGNYIQLQYKLKNCEINHNQNTKEHTQAPGNNDFRPLLKLQIIKVFLEKICLIFFFQG